MIDVVDDAHKELGTESVLFCEYLAVKTWHGVEPRTCGICKDSENPIDNSPSSIDIELKCKCAVHYNCLCSYVRAALGDRSQIHHYGINCPYYSPNPSLSSCSAKPEASAIIPTDIPILITIGNLNPDKVETFFIDAEATKLAEYMRKEIRMFEDNLTDAYILGSTKPCPRCRMRSTHYHGHNCHHISPISDGCPNCHTHYCYKCLSTDTDNISIRGTRTACTCQYWSRYCEPITNDEDVQNYLVLDPVPYDSRCGCVICPECRFGKPCAQCPGSCDVCLGLLNPGPLSLETVRWQPVPTGGRKTLAQYYVPTHNLLDNMLFAGWRRPRITFEDLCRACMQGQVDVVEQAITAGIVNITRRDAVGRSPLDYCCDIGSVAIAELLLNHSPDDAIDAPDREGYSPLLRATEYGHEPLVRLLVSRGAKLDVADQYGETAIIKACRNNDISLVQYFVRELHVNADTVTAELLTPLHFAAHYGNKPLVHLLLNYSNVDANVRNAVGMTALHWAVQSCSPDVVEEFIHHSRVDVNIGDNDGNTPLHIAVLYEKTDSAVILMQHATMACDMNVQNNDGYTPLHLCCVNGVGSIALVLLRLTDKSSNHRLQLLVNTRSHGQGFTPLLDACMHGFTSIVSALIPRGADYNACTTFEGINCLQAACIKGHTDIVQILLSCAKLDVNYRSQCGYVALVYAAKNDHTPCAKMILRHSQFDHGSILGTHCSIQDGMTAMHWAAFHDNLKLLQWLYVLSCELTLESHPNIDIRDACGRTPLYVACERDHTRVSKYLFTKCNASSTMRALNGDTPLSLAAKHSNLELLMLF